MKNQVKVPKTSRVLRTIFFGIIFSDPVEDKYFKQRLIIQALCRSSQECMQKYKPDDFDAYMGSFITILVF